MTTTVIFSNIRADLLKHRHHHVAAWRARSERTVWVDSLGSRNPRLSDLRRLGGENAGQDPGLTMPGVERLIPRVVPLHGLGPLYRLNRRLLERQLRAAAIDPRDSIAWFYLAHPVMVALARRLPWRRTLFDLCDDISDFAGMHPAVLRAEERLLAEVDVVLASSRPLVEKARRFRESDIAYVPNGVQAEAFADVPPPPERPPLRLLYFGSVAEWFDEDLLAAVAAARPDARIRVVGPVTRPLDRLPGLANVEIAGPVPAHRIPEELAGAHLTIIPFRKGPLIRATDALKVYEALAARRPVLVTEMPQAMRFSPAVRQAPELEDWLTALDELADGRWAPDLEAVRLRVAGEEDWSRRFEAMDAALEAA